MSFLFVARLSPLCCPMSLLEHSNANETSLMTVCTTDNNLSFSRVHLHPWRLHRTTKKQVQQNWHCEDCCVSGRFFGLSLWSSPAVFISVDYPQSILVSGFPCQVVWFSPVLLLFWYYVWHHIFKAIIMFLVF